MVECAVDIAVGLRAASLSVVVHSTRTSTRKPVLHLSAQTSVRFYATIHLLIKITIAATCVKSKQEIPSAHLHPVHRAFVEDRREGTRMSDRIYELLAASSSFFLRAWYSANDSAG